MAKGKKRNTHSNTSMPKFDTEYDVARSMQRVRKYRSSREIQTTRDATKFNAGHGNCDYLSNQYENPNRPTSEPARDIYFRLEDQMSAFRDKNEVAHNDLRKEIDSKISGILKDVSEINNSIAKKVSIGTFRWILGGIVTAVITIATIWYILSYEPLIKKSETHTESIHDLDKRINTLENTHQRPTSIR